MAQKFIEQALDRNNDFRELSKRMNIIMERYLDYRGYTVKDPEIFSNWARTENSIYIRYLESEEGLRMDIGQRIMGLECKDITLAFSLYRRANGFACSPSYYPAVAFHTHADDVADYMCYFAKLQEEGRLSMSIVNGGVIHMDDAYLEDYLSIVKGE